MSEQRRSPLLIAFVVAAVALACLVNMAASSVTSPPPEPRPSTGEPVEQEAVAAALDALHVLGSSEMYDQRERPRLLASLVAADGPAAEMDRAFQLAARTLAVDDRGRSPDGQLVSRLVPVGHRLLAFDGDRAEVAVWAVGLLGVAGETSPVPVAASWSTETLTLAWTDDRWVVTSVRHADGPTPIGSAQVPSAASAIARAASEFRGPGRAG